jgi:hypothetical protein
VPTQRLTPGLRLRPPLWLGWLVLALYLTIIFGCLGLFTYAWMHRPGTPSKGGLILDWMLGLGATILLARLGRALLRKGDAPGGPTPDHPSIPSDQRFERP